MDKVTNNEAVSQAESHDEYCFLAMGGGGLCNCSLSREPVGSGETPSPAPEASAPEARTCVERRIFKDSPEWRPYLSARFGMNGLRTGHSTFLFEGHRWAYRHSSFNDSGEFDLIFRWVETPAPSPVDASAPESLPASHGADGEGLTLCGRPLESVAISNRFDCPECKGVDASALGAAFGRAIGEASK